MMSDRLFHSNSQREGNRHRGTSSTPSTDTADSGIASRVTPLSSINENQFNLQTDDETDCQIASFPPMSNVGVMKPVLKYKTCVEYTEYPRCLITYIDHPSAIFFQIPTEGRAFQQMHQEMNRYYMENLTAAAAAPPLSRSMFHSGDFCVAYSARYFEFYRARILKMDYRNQQVLVIYVDFGDSEWVHMQSLRPLHHQFAQLEVQSIGVTLSRIVPKKDPRTGLINWNTHLAKQCTRKLRRLLIRAESEPLRFVSIRVLAYESFWPLALVEIKVDGQNLAEMLHYDELARLTDSNEDIRKLYPTFGRHRDEQLIFGLERCENRSSMINA